MRTKLSYHTMGVLLTGVIVCLVSCKKMDHTYAKYTENGEIIYVSKPDSVKAYPGKNRLLLAWPIGNDPKVSKARIFWNNKEDSADYNIDRKSIQDTAKVWFNDLPEGSYTFDIFTYDHKGNSSIKVSVRSNVYGENYKKTILNRKIKSIVYQSPSLTINWYDGMPGTKAVELFYIDQQDQPHTISVAAKEKVTIIPNVKNKSTLTYRTLFLPEPQSLDTFQTDPLSLTL